ncbi:hypothetical protein [Chryseobacterium oncorhynchi]|uniref:Uncharacterized protein n=1 Tax=Chryseobacterium oncorhynchi TaxID=741074 RepID=A0A316X5P9_9FLAO|nr:hypothetical protein [Chryseobacterium oncorhynchi]PWN66110.1 hypothetical protein C1638_006955 [Chryseobacterium oncorhynchi]
MTAKEFIVREIDELNDLISREGNKESHLQLKKELSETLYLLSIFDNHQINQKTIKTILELPDSNTGYSDYRIINDCESDNPDHWIEVSIHNEKLRLGAGDIIIKKK